MLAGVSRGCLLAVLALLGCGSATETACWQGVCLWIDEATPERRIVAENALAAPVRVWVARDSQRFVELVPPRSRMAILSLSDSDAADVDEPEFRWGFSLGDPAASPDSKFLYQLPFDAEEPRVLAQGPRNRTHRGSGMYAFDFAMPVGTPVLAARGGVVVAVVEEFDEGGPDEAYKRLGNYVTVMHSDGTFAHYGHLEHRGASVALGQDVATRDPIGQSGNTGYTTGPHLHFEVWQATEGREGRKSLRIRFDDGSPDGLRLRPGRAYPSSVPSAQTGREL